MILTKITFCKKKWVKTAHPALSSGQSNIQTPIWGHSRQLDDQHRNPNINNKDHHVGQLTSCTRHFAVGPVWKGGCNVKQNAKTRHTCLHLSQSNDLQYLPKYQLRNKPADP